MEMEGFTGLNIGRAKDDIERFEEQAYQASGYLYHTGIDFFDSLKHNWASPRAREYTFRISREFKDLLKSFEDTIQEVVDKAVSAGSKLAENNGDIFEYTGFTGNHWSSQYEEIVCDLNINNIVGMKTLTVKDSLDSFVLHMNIFSAMLDSLPKGVAFYDPAGKMLDAYNSNIDKFKDKFQEYFYTTKNGIEFYINTEKNTVLRAKQQAQDIMSA